MSVVTRSSSDIVIVVLVVVVVAGRVILCCLVWFSFLFFRLSTNYIIGISIIIIISSIISVNDMR